MTVASCLASKASRSQYLYYTTSQLLDSFVETFSSYNQSKLSLATTGKSSIHCVNSVLCWPTLMLISIIYVDAICGNCKSFPSIRLIQNNARLLKLYNKSNNAAGIIICIKNNNFWY